MTVPIKMITCKVVTLSWLQTDPHAALSWKTHHSFAWFVQAADTSGKCHRLHTCYIYVLPAAPQTDPIVRSEADR